MTTTNASGAAPRPRDFRDPLILTLAKATHATAHVFVAHLGVVEDTIREAGYDPDNLPEGWSRKCQSANMAGAGLDRNISLAFRYAYRDSKPALTVKGPRRGQWGLTDAGVAYAASLAKTAQPQPNPQPLPRPKIFRDPLIAVLGRLSGYRADVARDHTEVIRAVLVEIGKDPDNLPLGWGERGSNRQIKAYDRVRWAVKALKGANDPLIGQPKRGVWCLTEAGVQAAMALNGVEVEVEVEIEPVEVEVEPAGPNQTAIWLGHHCRPNSDLYKMMRAALAKRLPVSRDSHMIEDHIQQYLLRSIERNSLRKLLSDSQEIPYGKIVAYCLNSGRTDARNMGTDALCREMFGAKTEKERRDAASQREDGDAVQWEGCGNERARDTDGALIGGVAEDEDNLDFEALWRRIEECVQERKPQAWERYSRILALKAKGYTTREIAKAEGVSRNRAASMLAEARRCVREGFACGDLVGYI